MSSNIATRLDATQSNYVISSRIVLIILYSRASSSTLYTVTKRFIIYILIDYKFEKNK